MHEMVIGLGGLSPLLAGLLIGGLKREGWSEEAALQSPLFVLAALSLCALALQAALVSRNLEERALLGAKEARRE